MQQIENSSLSARMYELLRKSLICGDYVPDERLVMQDLAAKLGTSVTPVREACLRLVSDSALELRSGRFVTIPPFTRKRYWQIRVIRVALERLAASLAAENCTPADIEQLIEIHNAFVKLEASGDKSEARRLNQKFHFFLYELSGMEILVRQIESSWASMGPILNLYYSRAENAYVGADAHLGIIDALKRQDGEATAQAVELDITLGGNELLKILDSLESHSHSD